MLASELAGVILKDGRTIEADLVVDASGKSSAVLKWLRHLNHALPPSLVVDAGLHYATQTVELPEDPNRWWLIAMCVDQPANTRKAILLKVEDNKWQVLLTCCNSNR